MWVFIQYFYTDKKTVYVVSWKIIMWNNLKRVKYFKNNYSKLKIII